MSNRPIARTLGIVLPCALGLAPMLSMRLEVRTIAAPVLGPWAGHLYGHSECTMANALPWASWTAVGLGVVTLVLMLLARSRPWRVVAAVVGSIWSLFWNGLAFLSVVNASA
jgi:hypothetical protein